MNDEDRDYELNARYDYPREAFDAEACRRELAVAAKDDEGE